jgi:hypothetical protein
VPDIQTMSSSDSALTWPPTFFQVIVKYQLLDLAGKAVAEDVISGEGNASFSEFSSNFNLAAQRASSTAMGKLKQSLLDKAGTIQK